jgi:hypothetical protein
MGKFSELDAGLNDYIAHLQADYDRNGRNNKRFYFEIGRKYVHVIMEDNQRSSHSWVVIQPDAKFKFGDILKSASWKAPAKNFSRGNVIEGNFSHIRWCGI